MIRAAAALLALGLVPAPAAACDLAIALALDISNSVNGWEYDIQLGGIVAALKDEEIRAAVDEIAPVYVTVYEWSGRVQQDTIADWTRLDGAEDMDALAQLLSQHGRGYEFFPTAIGRAIEFGVARFGALPEPCDRRIIDISGDGVNNQDPPARVFHALADAAGVTINALVIKGAFPDPELHYRSEVIHGPGAFLLVAETGFQDYPELIKRKLLRELRPEVILGAAPPFPSAKGRPIFNVFREGLWQ